MLAVDVILLSNTAPALEAFWLKFLYTDSGGEDHLNRWVRYLTETRKVKGLYIHFPYFARSPPELHLCSPESITRLVLMGCVLKSFSCCRSFTSIDTLLLRGCSISNDYVNKFFAECPSLLCGVIKDFYPDGRLHFNAPWLKFLEICGPFKRIKYLKIHAPNLEGFGIYSDKVVSVRLDDMQSLTTLELFHCNPDPPFHYRNMAELRRVKKLKIHSDNLDQLYEWALRDQHIRIVNQLDSLEHLSVHLFKYSDTTGLLCITHGAPKLQKLTLNEFVMDYDEDEEFQPDNDDVDWSLFDKVALKHGSLKHLKQIEAIGFDGEHKYLRLFEFLLKHSSSLESLEIKFLEHTDASCRLAFETELLALPRGGAPNIHLS